MKIFGFEITRAKSAAGITDVPALAGVGRWLGRVHEPFTGAWQRNLELDGSPTMLTFSAVYACISTIAQDIGKLRPRLMLRVAAGTWHEQQVETAKSALLSRPNSYQTMPQFLEQWLISRLQFGNAYVLKERTERGVVRAFHVLDPRRVQALVTADGSVYYRLAVDHLSTVDQAMTVPASEIIHDRAATLFHPLVGVSPLYACARSATQGNRIQNNSAKFFENMSRPGGMLTAPESIDDETAARLKQTFEENFGHGNVGRLLVSGSGLKFEPIGVPAEDAQLIEQLKWTVEDVARVFRVPLYKIGAGPMPAYGNGESLNRAYYSETLQNIIESIEVLLDFGLDLGPNEGIEFDLEPLLRMDTAARYAANSEGVRGGWLTPNEARAREGLAPLPGGDSAYLQQQNYSLAALAQRDSTPPPPANKPPASTDEKFATATVQKLVESTSAVMLLEAKVSELERQLEASKRRSAAGKGP